LRNRAPRCQGNPGKSGAYQRLALRRLTPTTIRSTRQVLVSSRRAARAGVMPWRATIVQTCRAYSENGRIGRICRVGWLCMGPSSFRSGYRAGDTLRPGVYGGCQREPAEEGRQSLKKLSVRCS